MAFIAAKCSQCGANIQVDDSRESGFCTYCGAKFVTEKVVHNYITNNQIVTNFEQTTNINAQTVHLHNDEINRLFMIEEGVLVQYKGKLKKVTIPEGVLEIAEGAFIPENKNQSPCVEKIILPKSLTVIQSGAFSSSTIKEVVAPEDGNLRKIESGAFINTAPWQSGGVSVFIVPTSVVEIGKDAFGATVALFRETESEVRRKFPNLSNRIICEFEGLGTERGFSFVCTKDGAYIYRREPDSEVGYPATLGGKKVGGYFKPYLLVPPIERGVEVLPYDMFEDYKTISYDSNVTEWKIPNTVRRIEKGSLRSKRVPIIEFEEGTVLDFWSKDCISTQEEYSEYKTVGVANIPELREGSFDGLREVTITVDDKVRDLISVTFAIPTKELKYIEAARNGFYKNARVYGSSTGWMFINQDIKVDAGQTRTFYWGLGYLRLHSSKEIEEIQQKWVNKPQDGDVIQITVSKKFLGSPKAICTYVKRK